METIKLVLQELAVLKLKSVSVIVLPLLLLLAICSFGQTPETLSFEYFNPRNGKSVSASVFLNDFVIKATPKTSGCYFALATCRFRVAKTALIDSIAFEGELSSEFKVPIRQQVMESQQYWKCSDCAATGGHWVTIPIYVSFTHAGDCSSNDNHIYTHPPFWFRIFLEKEKEQIELFKSEWLLAPIFAVSMD